MIDKGNGAKERHDDPKAMTIVPAKLKMMTEWEFEGHDESGDRSRENKEVGRRVGSYAETSSGILCLSARVSIEASKMVYFQRETRD